MVSDIYAKSNRQLAEELGHRFRQYRQRIGYTQKDIAEKSGLSIFTISAFEKGTGTGLSLAGFIALLRSLEQLDQLSALLPGLPESPKAMYEKQLKKQKR